MRIRAHFLSPLNTLNPPPPSSSPQPQRHLSPLPIVLPPQIDRRTSSPTRTSSDAARTTSSWSATRTRYSSSSGAAVPCEPPPPPPLPSPRPLPPPSPPSPSRPPPRPPPRPPSLGRGSQSTLSIHHAFRTNRRRRHAAATTHPHHITHRPTLLPTRSRSYHLPNRPPAFFSLIHLLPTPHDITLLGGRLPDQGKAAVRWSRASLLLGSLLPLFLLLLREVQPLGCTRVSGNKAIR